MNKSMLVMILSGSLFALVVQAQTNKTYVGPNVNRGSTAWGNDSNWDPAGMPSGTDNVIIPDDKQAMSDGGVAVPYTGNLTLGTNARLGIGWVASRHVEDYNALGTPGVSRITMGADSSIVLRPGSWGTVDLPEIVLEGNALITYNSSTEPKSDYRHAYGINGNYDFEMRGQNSQFVYLTATNTVNRFILGRQGHSWRLRADVELALNGDVTVLAAGADPPEPAADLILNAANAISPSATLELNGSDSNTLVTVNADNTVFQLFINGVQQPDGIYNNSESWLSGSGTLTVKGPPQATLILLM